MATITEDYVSFETAKLFKEKGFDAVCPMIYTADGELLYTAVKHHNTYAVTNEKLIYYTDIIAPSQSMVMKWLREVHNVIIIIDTNDIYNENRFYFCKIYWARGNRIEIKWKISNTDKEYEYFAGKGSTYPLTVLVARKGFAEKNKELLDAFLAEYEESYNQTLRYPKKAGELCEKLDFGLAAGVVSTSIPRANYVFVSSEYARKDAESLLNLFLANDEASIGGKLPDDGFYFR